VLSELTVEALPEGSVSRQLEVQQVKGREAPVVAYVLDSNFGGT
jgi:hypothetical protein